MGNGGVQDGTEKIRAREEARAFLELAPIVVVVAGKCMLQERDFCREEAKHNGQSYEMEPL